MTHDTLGDVQETLKDIGPGSYVRLVMHGEVAEASVWKGEELLGAAVSRSMEEAIDEALSRAAAAPYTLTVSGQMAVRKAALR